MKDLKLITDLRLINNMIMKLALESFKEGEVTLSQARLLSVLSEKYGGQSEFKDMEHDLMIAQSSTVNLVKKLVDKGFIETKKDEKDKRVKIMSLTEKGKGWLRETGKLMDEVESRMLRGLSDEEMEKCSETLEKILNNVKAQRDA